MNSLSVVSTISNDVISHTTSKSLFNFPTKIICNYIGKVLKSTEAIHRVYGIYIFHR